MAFQGDTIAYIDQGLESDDHVVSLKKSQVQAKFLKFVAEWHEKEQYKYKEQLIKNSGLGKYVLAVEMKDMRSFCSEMSETIKQRPISYIPILEGALKELYASIQNIPISQAPDFQLQISSDELPQPLRTLKSNQIGNLINVSGIIINSGKTMLRGKKMKAICIGCGHELSIELSSGIEGANLPFFCTKPRTQGE
jgi:DNA replicative helicase MCM subunit Mcm2 (Cdc46/Mcm family)